MLHEVGDLLILAAPCLIVAAVLLGIPLALRARARRRAAKLAQFDSLQTQVRDALQGGQLDEAATLAEITLSYAISHQLAPALTSARLSMGIILARQSRYTEALAVLQTARAELDHVPNPPNGNQRAMVEANTSLVLRRLDRLDEAITIAQNALQHREPVSKTEPFEAAGPAYAELALALALTDKGLDGRAEASAGLKTFRKLEAQGHLDEGEGVAYACYVSAFARQPFDDAFEPLAHEAIERYTALHAELPKLYENRLADANALLA